jgi:hypothetical protein
MGSNARRHLLRQIHKPGKLKERISGKSMRKFVRQPVQILCEDAGFALDDAIRGYGHMDLRHESLENWLGV